jgi:hypothetical protein
MLKLLYLLFYLLLLAFHFLPYYGAGNGIRTRDPNLGKVVLYQLSYSRNFQIFGSDPFP